MCGVPYFLQQSVVQCRRLNRLEKLALRVGAGFPSLHSVSSSVPEDYIGRRNLEHVEALQESPVDPNQVVIGYGRGLMVIWDLEKQCALQHIPATQVSHSGTVRVER